MEAFRPPRPEEGDSGTIDEAAEDGRPSGFATANQVVQQQTRKDSRPNGKIAEDFVFHNDLILVRCKGRDYLKLSCKLSRRRSKIVVFLAV